MHASAMTATAILWFGVIAAVVGPLVAADAGVACSHGRIHTAFSPGITFNNATYKAALSGNIGPCSSVDYPNITRGTIQASAEGQGSCILFTASRGKVNIIWNTQESSLVELGAFKWNVDTFSMEGSITGKKFKGCSLRMSGKGTKSFGEVGLECATPNGVRNYEGVLDEVLVVC